MMSVHACIDELDYEKLREYLPVADAREEHVRRFLRTLKLAKRAGMSINNTAVIIAPTGAGKTTVSVALTAYLASECGVQSLYFTRGKQNRLELTLRYANLAKKMLEQGKEPPRVLVIFSRYDTCPNEELKRAVEELVGGEEGDEDLKIAAFYQKCLRAREGWGGGICPYFLAAQKLRERLRLPDVPILLSKKTDVKIPQQYSYIAPFGTLSNVDIVTSFDEYAELFTFGKVCVFEILPRLAEKYDIIVADHWHLALLTAMGWLRRELGERVVVVDEFHEVPATLKIKVNLQHVASMLKKYKFEDELKLYEKRLNTLATKYRVSEKDLNYGAAGVMTDQRDVQLLFSSFSFDKLAEALAEHEKQGGRVFRDQLELEKARILTGLRHVAFVVKRIQTSRGPREIYYLVGIVKTSTLRTSNLKILLTATGSAFDVWRIVPIAREKIKAEKILDAIAAAMKVLPLGFRRNTYILKVNASYPNRAKVVKLLDWIREVSPTLSQPQEEASLYKVVIASQSWLSLVEDVLGRDNVYAIPTVKDPAEREAVRLEARRKAAEGRWILLSPHSWAAVGLDLVDVGERARVVAVVLSESSPKSSVETAAVKAFFAQKRSPEYATLMFNVRPGVMRVLQALGRWQRDPENHEMEVWFIGKHFLTMDEKIEISGLLRWYKYSEMYSQPHEISPPGWAR